jgi:glyoxylase-like metal-dependent hydrolase (beta-lactamase superfamily II)
MHQADANVVRGSGAMLSIQVSPGLVNAILFRLFIKGTPGQMAPAEIEHEIQDGDVLPCGGGIKAIHTPGHSAGHMAFLLPQGGGVLLIGDACSNTMGLDYSIVYHDIQEARRSLAKLAQINCAAICFSHGKALKGAATQKFKNKWTGR